MRSLAVLFAVLLPAGIGACDRKVAGGRADGAAVFAEACARCHGDTGQPPPELVRTVGVKDLTAAEFKARATRAFVETQIRQGSANKVMPAFADVLTAAQIEALAAYVLSL
jgi:mono/diheme cytochrome c family protein